MQLAAQIREAMMSTHDAIEKLPIADAMAKGTVAKEDYVRLLVQLQAIHGTLETLLQEHHSSHPLVTKEVFRVDSIQNDLEYLKSDSFGNDFPLEETGNMQATLESWSKTEPIRLLGALYILEGSRMGSMVLARSLSRGFQVPMQLGNGLDYHLAGMSERPVKWVQFKTIFSNLPFSESDKSLIVDAAIGTMKLLYEVYQAAQTQHEAVAV